MTNIEYAKPDEIARVNEISAATKAGFAERRKILDRWRKRAKIAREREVTR